MNYPLTHIPARPAKPRESGLTMVMDKGLAMRQAEDMIEASGGLIDLGKLGFGTSFVTTKLKEKVKLYQKSGIRPSLHSNTTRTNGGGWPNAGTRRNKQPRSIRSSTPSQPKTRGVRYRFQRYNSGPCEL